jgi:hypothetical protein
MRFPLRGLLAVAPVLACIACSELTLDSYVDETPHAQVLAVQIGPGMSGMDVSGVGFKGLPPGRYAMFVGVVAPQDRAAILTFDVDKECAVPSSATTGTATDAGTSADSSSNTDSSSGADVGAGSDAGAAYKYTTDSDYSPCVGKGILTGGASARVWVFEITPGSVDQNGKDQRFIYAGEGSGDEPSSRSGHDYFVALRALDGASLATDVRVHATTIGAGSGGCSSTGPTIDSLTLQ